MSGHRPWRELFPFRVVPHTNSWNLSGWCIEYHGGQFGWEWIGRHYWTRRGARREMARRYHDYCWSRSRATYPLWRNLGEQHDIDLAKAMADVYNRCTRNG
jgi:hypothetical protein